MVARRDRLARARKAAGYTQESLAETLRIDRTTVARWEAGKWQPLPYLRPKLARMLGLTAVELSEILSAPIATSPSRSAAASAQSPAALNVDEQHHMTAALEDARRYMDGSVVEYFRRQLDACAGDDGSLGPAKTLPVVLGVLGAIEEHASDVRPEVRRDLLSVGALGAEFAGWLYRDMHRPQWATFWYTRATEWAQEACDTAMQGYVLLKKSQMAYDERDALRVLTLAQAAQYGLWQLSQHVRAEVTQQEARGLAMLGESISIIEQKLDDARQLIAAAQGVDDLHEQLGSPYNENTFALRNASCYFEVGKPQRAAGQYAEVLSTDELSPRDRGYFTARMASSLALAGEPDRAANVGLEAAQLATATTSQRTKRELMRALATLTPWQNRPGPRALREAVMITPGRQS